MERIDEQVRLEFCNGSMKLNANTKSAFFTRVNPAVVLGDLNRRTATTMFVLFMFVLLIGT